MRRAWCAPACGVRSIQARPRPPVNTCCQKYCQNLNDAMPSFGAVFTTVCSLPPTRLAPSLVSL